MGYPIPVSPLYVGYVGQITCPFKDLSFTGLQIEGTLVEELHLN